MDRVERFIENFLAAGGELADSIEQVVEEFRNLPFGVCENLSRKLEGYKLNIVSPEEAEVSLTVAHAACAETGSLIFAYTSEDEHRLISLPRIHVAVVKTRRIYARLETALSKVEGDYISIVTGTSKTGDIELIHVVGVHGPERVIVILEGR